MQIIILVSINTKNSMKQRELAEKSQFFQRVLKMGSFGQNAKRRPLHFVPGNVRMRKQHTKTTVLLDVVPERRTKRFPPRFRPVGCFCELRLRYLTPPIGREGEISRPLEHKRQIPFIHSARFIDSTNFYIYMTVF